MGKFNVTTVDQGIDPKQAELINKSLRSESAAELATPTEQLGKQAEQTIESGSLAEMLIDDGDLTPDQVVTPPIDEVFPEQPLPPEVGAGLEEEQRQREQIAPLSKRTSNFHTYEPDSSNPFHQQLERGSRLHQAFQADPLSPKPDIGSFITPTQIKEAKEGRDPFRDQTNVAATLTRYGAAEPDFQARGVDVDPIFTTVGAMVLEKFFQSQDGFIGETQVNFGESNPETGEPNLESVIEEDDGPAFTKAKGNERLGRSIMEEYLREKAVAEGLESDTYLLDPNMRVDTKDAEFVGGMMKEAYASTFPDFFVENDTNPDQVIYQPTAKAQREFKAADDAAGKPFDGREVPPLTTPPRRGGRGQPQFEAQTYTRAQTKNVGSVTPNDLKVINEARENFSQIPWKIDRKGEQVLYGMGMPAISEGIALYTTVFDQGGDSTPQLIEMLNTEGEDGITMLEKLKQDFVFAEMFNVGGSRLESLVGEYNKLEADVLRLRQQYLEAEDGKTREDLAEKGKEAVKLRDNYQPLNILRLEINKAIESMNTIARYQGQANYLTLSVQMLTGRMGVQQNKLNPQTNKWVRFALRAAGDNALVHPHGNSISTRNFKEIGAVLLLPKQQGKYAFTADRIRTFDQQLLDPNSRLSQLARIGKKLEAFNQDPTDSRELFRGVSARERDAQQFIDIPPAIRDAQAPELDADVLAELRSHDPEEIPYVIEYLQDLAKFVDGKPFNSTFEAEMDGITNGPSSNGYALGIENTMVRGGVLNYGPSKLMDQQDAAPKDLRDQIAEHMVDILNNDGDIDQYTDQIARTIIDNDKAFRKLPPMTTIYGQELASLRKHAENAFYTGPAAPEIQQIIKQAKQNNQQVDEEKLINYLHENLIVATLVAGLDPIAIQATRQLRANNVLALLTGEPLYYNNPMGFRGYAAGKAPTGEVEHSDVKVKGKRVHIPHYEQEVHGAAERQRSSGRAQVGGFGHGQIIPAVTQSYDATMISRSLSGKHWRDMSREMQQRNQQPGFLPIFDAGKAGYGKVDIVRKHMNEAWSQGIEGHNFIETIMGKNGWAEKTRKKAHAKLKDLPNNVPVVMVDRNGNPVGQYRGLADIMFAKDREKKLQRMIEGVFPFKDEAQLRSKELRDEHAKKLAKQLNHELGKIIKGNRKGEMTPEQIGKAIGLITEAIKLNATNASFAAATSKRRTAAFAKRRAQNKDVLQIDLG